jgi:hypothetical protein
MTEKAQARRKLDRRRATPRTFSAISAVSAVKDLRQSQDETDGEK